jgi:hypothetical protein
MFRLVLIEGSVRRRATTKTRLPVDILVPHAMHWSQILAVRFFKSILVESNSNIIRPLEILE